MEELMQEDTLKQFLPATERWFRKTFGEPTKIQKEAWPAIADGRHVLVSAPTGTGKTLSAFLVFIDQLGGLAGRGELKEELYVIYVSPLKSLAGDIRENHRKPLEGIEAEALEENRFRPESEEPGEGTPGGGPGKQSIGQIQAAIRTGDTPQKERQRMVKHPPHILKRAGLIQHPNQERGNDRAAHGAHKEWDYIGKNSRFLPHNQCGHRIAEHSAQYAGAKHFPKVGQCQPAETLVQIPS